MCLGVSQYRVVQCVCVCVYVYIWSCSECVGVYGVELLDVFVHVYWCVYVHNCVSVCLCICPADVCVHISVCLNVESSSVCVCVMGVGGGCLMFEVMCISMYSCTCVYLCV